MTEEDAFLRAIQEHPDDTTVMRVYADWLEERGEAEKAEYVRLRLADEVDWRRYRQLRRGLNAAWLDLLDGRPLVWDATTALALGRLAGFLHGTACCNAPQHSGWYDFEADLVRLRTTVVEAITPLIGEQWAPVALDLLDDWETELREVLRRWLCAGLQLSPGPLPLYTQTSQGRYFAMEEGMSLIQSVIRPRQGWRVRIRWEGFYTFAWDDLALEAEDRVLLLRFAISDLTPLEMVPEELRQGPRWPSAS